MTSTDDILRKIRGLIKLANDKGATPSEAEAALGRAAHLQAQHGITDVQVEAAISADTGEVEMRFSKGDIVKEQAWQSHRINRWDWSMLEACATVTDCQTYRSAWTKLYVYGLPTDVAVCLELYKFVRSSMTKSIRLWCRHKREQGYHIQANDIYGRSFKDGFCAGLNEAAREAKKAQQQDESAVNANVGGSMALVPLKDMLAAKQSALADWRKDMGFTKARSSRVQRRAGAYSEGAAAGIATNINPGVIDK